MKGYLSQLALILFLTISTSAQQNPPAQQQTDTTDVKKNLEQQRQAKAKEKRGVIKGRVVRDDGQSSAHIGVNIYSAGQQGNARSVGTDEEGSFEADDLLPGTYIVSTFLPGYTKRTEPGERTYHHIGDTVTLTLVKGGVITGAVRTASGEPVINVGVKVLRVRDAEGKLMRAASTGQDRRTDDRGVYRIYGLQPGAYLVLAGGGSPNFIVGFNRYQEDVATYYPSSTRDTAVEVMVQNGQEASGIDITYRGEKGHAISGTVSGLPVESSNSTVNLTVMQAATGVVESYAYIPGSDSKKAFSLFGLADGDYVIRAESGSWPDQKKYFAVPPRRISVKGADVTGLELVLAPQGSISGRLVLELATGAGSKAKCEAQREAAIEETLVLLARDSKGEAPEQRWAASGAQSSANDKGEFNLYRLSTGTYRPSFVLPSETWYVKSATLSDLPRGNQPNLRSQQPSDVASRGLAVKGGEQLAGVVITLAEGAASLSGAVKAAQEKEALPPRLRLYLIPAEKESANDVLRYYQAEAQFDGAFRFANLAPGKYWLLSKIASEDEWKGPAGPLYWYGEGRLSLRKEAEAANNAVELPPCRKLTDFSLRHGVASAAVTPAVKK
jgi:hypothetical protein